MENQEHDEEAERQARTLEAMREGGVSTDEYNQVDYFGFEEIHRVLLPDGKSYVEHQTLNEGARRKYMNRVNREVRLQKGGDAYMKMATGDERHALLQESIIGWNLVTADRTGELKPLQFTAANVAKFLERARPSDIDLVEKDVRDKNSWLVGDVTIEDIDTQIQELTEMRAKKVEEAEGKES